MKHLFLISLSLFVGCTHFHMSRNGIAGQIGCPAEKVEIIDTHQERQGLEQYMSFTARCEDKTFVCSSRQGWIVCSPELGQKDQSLFSSHMKKQPPFDSNLHIETNQAHTSQFRKY